MNEAMRLDGLRVHYGRVRALDGLSLTVPEGEIEVFGRRMKRVPATLKRSIGYVSQEQHFYPWMTARRLGRFVAPFYPSWNGKEASAAGSSGWPASA